MAKNHNPYVYRSTIWKSVGGGFSYGGESKLFKVGKHKVLLSRSERLDKYGNAVHTATVINPNGSLGSSYRGNGSATLVVSKALKRNGINTKYSKNNRPKKSDG